jgi:hypothetical protein
MPPAGVLHCAACFTVLLLCMGWSRIGLGTISLAGVLHITVSPAGGGHSFTVGRSGYMSQCMLVFCHHRVAFRLSNARASLMYMQ